MPKVSVILSAYNAEKYIAMAVESILKQTFGDFEFFIVNDASTDRTSEIIKSFTDSRIISINNMENLGVAVSANICMDAAKGEYIARMDADDISFSHRFELQVNLLDNNPKVGICGAWLRTIGSGKNYTEKYAVSSKEIKFRMLLENPFAQPVIMLRKSFFDKYGLRYVSSYFPSEDYELWARAISFFDGANIPEVLLNYRIHPENASNTKHEKQMKDTDLIRTRQLKHILGEINDAEADVFLQLLKKCGGRGIEFIDTAKCLLLKMHEANKEKRIYAPEYMNPFIASCWSYACKTDFSYGLKVYAGGLEKFGIKSGAADKAAQFLKTAKYFLKNRIS